MVATPLFARRSASQSGHALLATMMVVLLLTIAAALVFSVVVSQQREQLRSRHQLDLRAMNDAVIAETLAQMSLEPRSAGVAEKEMTPGIVRSEIQEVDRDRFRIQATAKIGNESLETELIVTTSLSGPRVRTWRRFRASSE